MKESYDAIPPSRTALKRQARQVEDVARGLLDLGASQLDRLEWEDALRSALDLARATKQHGARKRQVKHLAAMLRQAPEALESARSLLEARNGAHHSQVRDFHHLEELRERMCQAQSRAAALQEALQRYPACDRALLEQLAQRYAETGDRRPYREIFRHLRAAAEKAQV